MSFAESNGVVHAQPMQNIGSSDGGAAPVPYYPILPPLSSSSPPTTTMETYQVSPAAGAAVPVPLSFPVDPMVSMDPTSIEPAKRKRGRPRKYAPDGAANSGMMSPPPLSAAQVAAQSGGGFSPTEGVEGASFAKKKGRGRPPGSGKKQQLGDLGSAGAGTEFRPQVIAVKAGEALACCSASMFANLSLENHQQQALLYCYRATTRRSPSFCLVSVSCT